MCHSADVRGYYRLAALRFADTVTLSIVSRMFPRIVGNLDLYLEQKLGLFGEGASAACRGLMDEDVATAARRESLKVMAEKLKKAEASIQELEMEASEAEPGNEGDGAGSVHGPDSSETMDEV